MTENDVIKSLNFLHEQIEGEDTMVCYTSDEVEATKEAVALIQELQEYREIGTVAECRNAVARMRPKKVISEVTKIYKCPKCESTDIFKYCGQCGCEIDWSDEE